MWRSALRGGVASARRVGARPSIAQSSVARFITACAVSACGALVPPCASALAADAASGEAATAEVVVHRAGQECFASLVHAFGYLVPRASAVVMFNAPDFKINEVRAKAGDRVRRGDTVAVAVPVASPGTAASGPAGAQGAQQQAPAEVPIRSLASGTVLQAAAFRGQLMSQKSAPLFTLAVDGEIEAAITVPSIHAGELSNGQAVHLATRDGTILNGHIRLMPVRVDPASQMGEVRVSLDGDARPAPGRFLRATVEASRSCNIGVPRAALRHTSAGMQVEIVENGIVLTRPVRIGLTNDADAEVTAGLAVGDLVVANAGSSLRSGDHVHAIFADLQDAR